MTSAAVALALQSRGVGVAASLAAGLAFHAVETLAGVTFGAVSVALLAGTPGAGRRQRVRLVLVVAALLLVSAFAATMLVEA